MSVPMLRPLVLAAALASATGLVAPLAAAQNTAPSAATEATLLSISTHAEASRAPDIASISAGVVTQAADGNTALRQNAERMTRVLAAIKAAGIPDKDVQTSGIHLNPQYQYADHQPPKIAGYQASNSVKLKVRDLSRLGKALDALAAQGANQINGPTFGIDDPEPLYTQARRDALKQAQARADTYARALGLKVRRIVSLDEGSGGNIRPLPMRAMARTADAESTPVASGETSVSVNLDAVFELAR